MPPPVSFVFVGISGFWGSLLFAVMTAVLSRFLLAVVLVLLLLVPLHAAVSYTHRTLPTNREV